MYEKFYHLKAEPFRLSPDHHFCFTHKSYSKAKAYMQYAFQRAEGFVMITGRPGTGKTTLVNDLTSSLPQNKVKIAMLVCTQLEASDLLYMVAGAFGVPVSTDRKSLVLQRLEKLFRIFYQEGKRALLIIDEAQDLSPSALEELRLLTNLQVNSQPLLQIFLLGQEELREMIHQPNMEQVHQRLVAACHLQPLNQGETKSYIMHRLTQVGWKNNPAISEAVYAAIYSFSTGIPRRINLLCSRLFLHSCVEELIKIGIKDAEVVLKEMTEEQLSTDALSSNIDFEVTDHYEMLDTATKNTLPSPKEKAPVQSINLPKGRLLKKGEYSADKENVNNSADLYKEPESRINTRRSERDHIRFETKGDQRKTTTRRIKDALSKKLWNKR